MAERIRPLFFPFKNIVWKKQKSPFEIWGESSRKYAKYRAFVFSHPDCNRRYGNLTRSANARGLYRRCGISPTPKESNIINDIAVIDFAVRRNLIYSTFSGTFKENFIINEERTPRRPFSIIFSIKLNYARISATTPEPTVLPPSRIAKRRPFSIAIAEMSSTVISTLSPGRHISTPAGRLITPVTSVVLK